MPKTNVTRRLAVAAGLLASAIWGSMYVVSKVVLEVIPPFTLLTLRLLLGFTALLLWKFIRGDAHKLTSQQWQQLLGLGALGYGVSLGFQFLGTKLSTAANAAVTTAAFAAFVYIFAFFILKERIGNRKLSALLIASIGVFAVIDPGQAKIEPQLWLGNLYLIGAAITWALYSVLVRRLAQALPVLTITLIAFLGGSIVSAPLAIWELQAQIIGQTNQGIFAGVLYLGVVSTAIAMLLWNMAYQRLEAGVAGLTFFAQPIVGAGLGVLLLGERISGPFIIGAFLILLGIYLAAVDNQQGAHKKNVNKD